MNPERPALDAVLAALDGITTPREAVEVLAARDLWPLENGPRVVGGDTAEAVAGYIRDALSEQFGAATDRRHEHLLRELNEGGDAR